MKFFPNFNEFGKFGKIRKVILQILQQQIANSRPIDCAVYTGKTALSENRNLSLSSARVDAIR